MQHPFKASLWALHESYYIYIYIYMQGSWAWKLWHSHKIFITHSLSFSKCCSRDVLAKFSSTSSKISRDISLWKRHDVRITLKSRHILSIEYTVVQSHSSSTHVPLDHKCKAIPSLISSSQWIKLNSWNVSWVGMLLSVSTGLKQLHHVGSHCVISRKYVFKQFFLEQTWGHVKHSKNSICPT